MVEPTTVLWSLFATVVSLLVYTRSYDQYGITATFFALLLLSLYDRYTRKIPTRLREGWGPRSAYGLIPVQGFGSYVSRIGIDVIFVHGLGSNPDLTWTARGLQPQHTDETVDNCWVTDFLPNDVPKGLRKNIRMYFYNYDSYWKRDAVQVQLANFGSNFLHRLKTDIRGTDEERQRHLIFVGHSYGGLVIKRALVQASGDCDYSDIIEHTKAILFLGTPHRGSSSSAWGMTIAKCLRPVGSNPVLFYDILYDSITLQNLHDEFVRKCPNLVRVVNFSEERKTRIGKIWFHQLEDFCVKEQSACYSAPGVHNCSLSVDHSGLNKYRSMEDGNYKTILKNLLSIFKEILPSNEVPYFSVPFKSVFTYAERKSTSSRISQALTRENCHDHKLHALIIHGLGGVGKSQLALNYLENHREQYNAILWINAESERTTIASFERCARALGISNKDHVTQSSSMYELPIIEKVCQWLDEFGKSRESSLIVFDNVDNFEWGIKKVIPRCSNGSIIITSRDKYSKMLLDGQCEVIEVGSLDVSESRTILFNRLGFETERASDSLIDICNDLAKKMGNLALAVDLAGAYISNEDDKIRGLEEYVNDFDKEKEYFLRNNELKGLLPTEKTVYTVWDKTNQKIRELYPLLNSDLFLTFLAHFRGAIIQYELFRHAHACVDDVDDFLNKVTVRYNEKRRRFPSYDNSWRRFDYTKCFRSLLRYGLLQETEDSWKGVTMHSLVRWRALCELQRHSWELWYLEFMICVVIVHKKRTSELMFTWVIMPHIPESGFCDRILPNDLASISIISLFCCVYEGFSKHQEVTALCREAITIHGKIGAVDDFMPTLMCRMRLGTELYHLCRYDEAEQEFLKVTQLEPSSSNAVLLESILSHESLAMVYGSQYSYEKAERLLRDAIERRTRLLGPDHRTVTSAKEHLALTYQCQKNWDMFELMESELPRNDGSLTFRDFLRACTYLDKGEYPAALDMFSKLWDICEGEQGYSMSLKILSGDKLAHCYAQQHQLQAAEELQKAVLERASRDLGPDHYHIPTCILTLVMIYRYQGELKKALGLLEELSHRQKKVTDSLPPYVLRAWDELREAAVSHTECGELVGLIDRSKESITDGLALPVPKKQDEKGKGAAVKEVEE